MLIKYICDSKLQTLHMRYPFQSISRLISLRNVWSVCIYVILLQDFAPEWNSHPGTTTGVNSHLNLPWHDILWWYHVTNVEPWEVAFFCMNPEGGEWSWWKVLKNIITALVYFIILLLWVTFAWIEFSLFLHTIVVTTFIFNRLRESASWDWKSVHHLYLV